MHTLSPQLEVAHALASRPTESFCQRLIEFYHHQIGWYDGLSPIWKGVIDLFWKPISKAVDGRDAAALADVLQDIYLSDCMNGIDIAAKPGPEWERWLRDTWSEALLDSAMAIGVIPRFSEEQPMPRLFDAEGLLDAVEVAAGGRIDCPMIARMAGIRSRGRFVPYKIAEVVQIVVAMRRLLCGYPQTVAEIGAGTGLVGFLLCSLAGQSGVQCRYHTIDLPIVSLVHAFLLSQLTSSGEKDIWLAGETPNQQACVHIHGLKNPVLKCNLIFNQNSFPEMSEYDGDHHMAWISDSLAAGGFFLSINHESNSGNQRRVFDVIQKHVSLRLRFRAPHLGRRGYMTEAYEKTT